MLEPRRIQKVGYSTLSVSIPMSWAKKANVKKGDIVFLSEEGDGALRITPGPTKTEDLNVYVVNADQCVLCLKNIEDKECSPYCSWDCAEKRYQMNINKLVDDSTFKEKI